jgi:hypothetical protein
MRTACPPLRRVLPPHRDTFRRQLGIGGGADRAGCNARPTNAPGCRVRVEIGGCGRAGGQRATQRLECDRRLDAADGRVEIPVRSRSSRAGRTATRCASAGTPSAWRARCPGRHGGSAGTPCGSRPPAPTGRPTRGALPGQLHLDLRPRGGAGLRAGSAAGGARARRRLRGAQGQP